MQPIAVFPQIKPTTQQFRSPKGILLRILTYHAYVKLYADEGISGTKIKNRKEFLRMMSDAEKGMFDMVVVKDISRFARNTVDLFTECSQVESVRY